MSWWLHTQGEAHAGWILSAYIGSGDSSRIVGTGQQLPPVEVDPPTKLALQLPLSSECRVLAGKFAVGCRQLLQSTGSTVKMGPPILRGSSSEASFRPPVSGNK
jgi:hypothetical protein